MTLRHLIVALFALLIVAPQPASAALNEVIGDFSVHASISADGRTSFREDISYDFGPTQRHGIYRLIPVEYIRYGARYGLNIMVGEITRDGAREAYQQSEKKDVYGRDQVFIRIGKESETISGKHEYSLAYATSKAINFFKDHDELYWNVTGNGWDVPIERSSFFLTLPSNIPSESVTTVCFTGLYGSTEQACTMTRTEGGIEFSSTRVLSPREGLTIVVAIPKGFVHEPTWFERFKMLLIDNRSLFIPLIVFAIMYWLWRTRGKDPEFQTIIPLYEPPDRLAPAVVQSIWSYGNTGDRGVTGTIIDLAERGYLHIAIAGEDGESLRAKDFTLKKMKEADDDLSPIEWVLFKGLFSEKQEVTLTELQEGKFYTSISKFKKSVHEGVNEMHVFEKDPTKVRGWYVIAGFMVAFVPLLFGQNVQTVDIAAFVLTAIIIVGIGWHMPRRTISGTRLEERIEGFKLFLSVTEKDRMAFHDAPVKRPEQFSKYLAYAVVFGVEEEWAEQFAGMDVPPPQWAEGHVSVMNTVFLASAMSSFNSSAASVYAPPSSAGSGGSGFSGGGSGGGGGGGGGGSW